MFVVVCRLLSFLTFSVVVTSPRKLLYTTVCKLLFLTFSILVANPRKLFYTVANPGRGLLNGDIYLCIVITYRRLWINQLSILLVISWTGKMKI